MITFVLPWYGPDTAGGAETQARGLVGALRDLGVPVRVWASTGRDFFHPSENAHYSPGHGRLDGVPLWRFRPTPASPEGLPGFFAARRELLPELGLFAAHELRLLSELLGSDELYEAVLAEREQTRFVFLPYPYPTTFWGSWLAGDAGYLLACLHDEPYARYSTYRAMFGWTRGMLANSHAEAALAQQLYRLPAERICVAGEGVDLTPRGDGTAFRRRYGLEATPLLLYAGRRDESKNVPLLLAFVREYWARRGGPLRLALMGQGELDLAQAGYADGLSEIVLDLGFVDAQTKHDAYAAADLFVQPSLHESFSIVLMEAWLQGAPALVHAGCAVTAEQAQRSGGGLSFDGFGAFAAALDLLLGRPELRRALGERGRAYVLETCRWDVVARRTADFVLSASF